MATTGRLRQRPRHTAEVRKSFRDPRSRGISQIHAHQILHYTPDKGHNEVVPRSSP
jgi:hypothetical protein